MPVSIRNRLASEVARGVEVSLNMEARMIRDRVVKGGVVRYLDDAFRKLKRLARREAARRGFGGARLSPEGASGPATRGGVNPENIVWIFGAGRSGTTWLASMMGDMRNQTIWFEPWVGALFDPERMQVDRRKGKHFILAPQYKETWLRSIRNFVLDGANVRFPEVTGREYLVAKEPGGSVGAVLLTEALPESRVILLVRDPRDYTASWVDAHREGSWRADGPRAGDKDLEDSTKRAAKVAKRYLHHVGEAKRAYDAHRGRKVLVRYEDLRADTLGTMKRIYTELGIEVDQEELAKAVHKHSWENIPEEQKGEGKFYRKAKPGGWREDLTPEQIQIVEEVTAPLLREFYSLEERNEI